MDLPDATAPTIDNGADSPATSAREKVFGTVELLESVLVHLPMRNILHAQRVARQWRAVIEGSLMLQKMLFFVADGFRDKTQSPLDITVGPYLALSDPMYPKTAVFTGIGTLFSRFPSSKPSNTHINFSSPNSWKRMLICQPPVRQARIICTVRSPKTARRRFSVGDVLVRTVKNELGVTGADIVAVIAQISKQWEWGRLREIIF